MKTHYLRLCVTTIVAIAVSTVVACGETEKHSTATGTSSARKEGRILVTYDRGKVAINTCLKSGGVKGVRQRPDAQETQHGETGLMRYGEPLTRQEAKAVVRRCVGK
jgi:hypothetical protein